MYTEQTRPAVSVIVTVYNGEEYLRECLDSVLKQTLQDIQLICVNDGSTDGSAAILKEYARMHSVVEIVDKQNGGLSSARNAGLEHARGEYIQFLDCDDCLEPTALEQLYQAASAEKMDILFYDGVSFFEDHRLHEQYTGYDTLYTSKEIITEVKPGPEMYVELCKSRSYRSSACLQIIRLDYIREKGLSFYEGLYYEDNLFTFTSILQAERVGQLAVPLYRRRMHDNSIVTSRKNMAHVRSYLVCMIEITAFLEKNQYGADVEKAAYSLLNTLYANAQKAYDALLPEEKSAKELGNSWIKLFLAHRQSYAVAEDQFKKAMRDHWAKQPYDAEKPFVSIVSPVYNTGEFLHDTIRDIQAQSMQNFEVWFVDDGSTDSSVEIIESYAKNDTRIKLLKQKNQYAGVARNNGLSHAKGEYVMFLDSDDRYDPNLLTLAYGHAKIYDAQVVIYDADKLQMPAGSIVEEAWMLQSRRLPRDVFSGVEVKEHIFDVLNPWTKLYQREYIQKNGFRYQELFSTNDAHFTMMALSSAERIVALPAKLVHYRVGGTQNIQSRKDKSPLDVCEAFLETKRQLQKRGTYPVFAKPLAAKAMESVIGQLNTLKSRDSYQKLYNYLHEGGLKEMDFHILSVQDMTISRGEEILAHCARIEKQTFEEFELQQLKLTATAPTVARASAVPAQTSASMPVQVQGYGYLPMPQKGPFKTLRKKVCTFMNILIIEGVSGLRREMAEKKKYSSAEVR